ncbi:MAG: dockerin type I domain-containing protein [Ruminococcus sp.]|nr:dockerin type I domain-containing protein [Ruminococcus sp.]
MTDSTLLRLFHAIIGIDDSLLGDVNSDGIIDAIDASLVLAEYAKLATNQSGTFTDNQELAADVNGDNTVDAVDASKILAYYAAEATGKTPSWD